MPLRRNVHTMATSPTLFAIVFGVIFLAELPDKTALAALLLASGTAESASGGFCDLQLYFAVTLLRGSRRPRSRRRGSHDRRHEHGDGGGAHDERGRPPERPQPERVRAGPPHHGRVAREEHDEHDE